MPRSESARTFKRATNLSIDNELLSEARQHKINISRAAESGIAQAIASAKSALWKDDNRPAIQSSNAYVESNGLPLERYRQF
ncbi:type II toxin-antitoxin system CcdA family antitoxin [Brucella sp. NM4]|uniref:type II toxin-antitoxin system CcdA family antitoxin n=1 Tax=Brucella/Ochrobactrum group TaxID=2826938 RepID=UPI0024BC6800|nr:type II toxin-antitoxin system CcdA family antitoxin [Brucella sp. NM4]WHS29826.1 type II toxin-antitoxin system CcdA family antitoxin [Brucella sp. NM4]WHT44688.1 type II toxin-antitoxin system CcdA family antitoxin [Ochrobactrum sp. SSR]